jgi:hypothetical protein
MAAPTDDDERALRRLLGVYAAAVDDRDPATMIATFAPGGKLVVYEGEAAQPSWEYNGDEVAGVIADMERYYLATFHFLGNFVCDVDGDRATGNPYCIAYHLRDDGRGRQVISTPIRYRDTYVRTPAGWRFELRRCHILWRERRLAVQWPP